MYHPTASPPHPTTQVCVGAYQPAHVRGLPALVAASQHVPRAVWSEAVARRLLPQYALALA